MNAFKPDAGGMPGEASLEFVISASNSNEEEGESMTPGVIVAALH